jgi:hypothetical protein
MMTRSSKSSFTLSLVRPLRAVNWHRPVQVQHTHTHSANRPAGTAWHEILGLYTLECSRHTSPVCSCIAVHTGGHSCIAAMTANTRWLPSNCQSSIHHSTLALHKESDTAQ